MPLIITEQEITTLQVDAIVCMDTKGYETKNNGIQDLQILKCENTSYGSEIHAKIPVLVEGTIERIDIWQSYLYCLLYAKIHNCESVALPCIDIPNYTKEELYEILEEVINRFLMKNVIEVYLVK